MDRVVVSCFLSLDLRLYGTGIDGCHPGCLSEIWHNLLPVDDGSKAPGAELPLVTGLRETYDWVFLAPTFSSSDSTLIDFPC